MASRLCLATLGAVVLTAASAASPTPYLRTAGVQRGHVVAVFSLGELAPGHIRVATRPRTLPNGAFVTANVRLDEALRPTRVANGYRTRTRHTLTPGRYYVEVSGIVLGLDCTPLKPCRQDWSNVRRVVIPRP